MWFLAMAWSADVDRIEVASRLLADGHHERAERVLAEVASPKKADLARYHTLVGMVALEQGDADGAVVAWTQAVEAGAPVTTRVLLAAAYDALKRPNDVLLTLTPEEQFAERPTAWTLRSRAHMDLRHVEEAFAIAEEGVMRFPDHLPLQRTRLTQWIDLGLTRRVVEVAATDLAGADESLWVELADGMMKSNAHRDAWVFTEQLLLAHPDSLPGRVAMGSSCLALERWHCASVALSEAAAMDPVYAVQAAESFRRTGDLDRAFYYNAQVVDPVEKARQRLGLLLQAEDFTGAVALDARLVRLGLVDDDSVAYALAYAHVKVGTTDRAETLLTRLTEPALVRQGTVLLESL